MTTHKQIKTQSNQTTQRLNTDAETLCAIIARIVTRIVTEPQSVPQRAKA